MARRLIILGSTGSIGTSALQVVEHLDSLGQGNQLDVVGLAAGRNATLLLEQARRFGVKHVAISDSQAASSLDELPWVADGPDAALELVRQVARPGDIVLGAMVGASGILPTIQAIESGCDIALANKETLVAAGSIVMKAVQERNVTLLPVDSEHNAIFQCLQCGKDPKEVHRIVLTASGGPFRKWTRKQMDEATPEQALKHPTWNMGRKVTIDSATMMNKALEIIEAHWLFDMEPERISAIIHPQSMVHGMVEFIDGSVIAHMNPPDMRTPIQDALCWPERLTGCADRLDWNAIGQLEFEPIDLERFPAISLAYDAIRSGGSTGAVLNAANEIAVNAFLEGRIRFGGIVECVQATVESVQADAADTLEEVMAVDRQARSWATGFIEQAATAGSTGASSG